MVPFMRHTNAEFEKLSVYELQADNKRVETTSNRSANNVENDRTIVAYNYSDADGEDGRRGSLRIVWL